MIGKIPFKYRTIKRSVIPTTTTGKYEPESANLSL